MSLRKGKVWCDARSLATGCALEVDGCIVEDGAWLRKKDDGAHINMAELDSVIKGLNLAAKWELEDVKVVTDSATVFGWLNSTFQGTHKIRTRGMSEMLVKRRLSVAKEICDEYKLQVSMELVGSSINKADILTRVCKRWLSVKPEVLGCAAVHGIDAIKVVRQIHDRHHLGIDRTFFLVKSKVPGISRDLVAKVVRECRPCCSVDPAPVSWEHGGLSCEVSWFRVAVDVTHFNGQCYLTLVDCGPSRFNIWRRVRGEDADSIVREMELVFRERGPPAELLFDNGAAFRSEAVRKVMQKWSVHLVYRCAYRPAGNGIVERCHRTIKRMATRSNADVLDMVFWYNVTPKEGCDPHSVPSSQLFNYLWRRLLLVPFARY